MRTTIVTLGVLLSGALTAAPALAQSGNPGSVTPPAPIMMENDTPRAVPQRTDASAGLRVTPPPSPAEVPIARTGEWIYTAQCGYLWVPSNATTYVMDGAPAAFMYTEEFGWTWYGSPWGEGPFKLGAWVARPWSSGFRAWASGPGGGSWRAPSSGHPVGGRMYGAAGHYFGAGEVASAGAHYAGTGGGSHQSSSRSSGARTEGRGARR